MLTPRRIAQLSLSAACLTLVTCITVLIAGGGQDPASANPQINQATEHSHTSSNNANEVSTGDIHPPLLMAVR